MNSEHKFGVWVIGIVSVSILTLALVVNGLNNARIKTYVENGYTQATLQGSESAKWVKEDKSN